jgi:hypothetical protein
MIPIRANIVGPPEVATRINASNGRLPFRGLMLCLAKPRDVPAGILERDELAAARQRNRIIKPPFPTARGFHRSCCTKVASGRGCMFVLGHAARHEALD